MNGRSTPGLLAAGLICGLVFPMFVLAQANSGIAGSWKLDPRAPGGAGGRGRAGGPGATELVITVSPSAVSVTSDTGTNRNLETAVFRLDGNEHEVPGPLSWNSLAKAAWEGGTLVVTIARIIEGPVEPIRIEMKDVYTVAGDVLTIERSQGKDSWKSVYVRP
jgi:hypothetical protein